MWVQTRLHMTWYIHMCAMTHPYVRPTCSLGVTWWRAGYITTDPSTSSSSPPSRKFVMETTLSWLRRTRVGCSWYGGHTTTSENSSVCCVLKYPRCSALPIHIIYTHEITVSAAGFHLCAYMWTCAHAHTCNIHKRHIHWRPIHKCCRAPPALICVSVL